MKERQFMNPGPTSHLRLQIFMCWLLLLGLLNAAPPPNTENIRLITKETSLGKVPFMADLKNLAISSDNQHVAFPILRAGKWVVWEDGVERAEDYASAPTANTPRMLAKATPNSFWFWMESKGQNMMPSAA